MKLFKKLLALTLVLCMVFCLSSAVFAVDEDQTTVPSTGETDGDSDQSVTLTYVDHADLKKVYGQAGTEGGSSPAETFYIEQVGNGTKTEGENTSTAVPALLKADNMPSDAPTNAISYISYVKGDAGNATNMTKTFTIKLPEYTNNGVGVYEYKLKEIAGNTAGVTYYAKEIKLVVTVVNDNNGYARVVAVHAEDETDNPIDETTNPKPTKKDNFPNTYTQGSLKVEKTVTGLLGDKTNTKKFEIKVTFTAPNNKVVKSEITYGTDGTVTFEEGKTTATATINLGHGESVTFKNIPDGVTYKVEETDYSSDGYQASYSNQQGTINNSLTTCTVTNTKNGEIDMGVSLDSLPYILALAVAFGGAVVMITRKRHVED